MDVSRLLAMTACGNIARLSYCILFSAFVYCVIDAFLTRRSVKKRPGLPLVGSFTSLVPSLVLNLQYVWKATQLAESGYYKYPGQAFQLMRAEGPVVVLPHSLLEELSRLPSDVVEATAALERDLVGSVTGADLVLENRSHHAIVQRKLTPRLPQLLRRMEAAAIASFATSFPDSEEWTVFKPYMALRDISARLSAEVIVGPPFCNDPTWLHAAVMYTEYLFQTVVVLRCFPTWTRPVLACLLPSYWRGRKLLRSAQDLLRPKISHLSHASTAGTWQPHQDKPGDFNVLAWLCGRARGNNREPDTVGHLSLLVALAAVHTTLLRMVNVLYDVTAAGSGLLDELSNEIARVDRSGWHDISNPYDALDRLDSVLRESQRMSPPMTIGMKRLFKKPYTFQDGTRVDAGTYACMAVYAIENDPSRTCDPDRFDGLRAYRAARDESATTSAADEHLFSSPSPDFLSFGYGKTACPGRFFASVVVKMVTVKALSDYEFRFMPGEGRPRNLIFHEFLFPWPETKMMVRRKPKGSCPF